MKILSLLLLVLTFMFSTWAHASGEGEYSEYQAEPSAPRYETASQWAGYTIADIDDLVRADHEQDNDARGVINSILSAIGALSIIALAALASFLVLAANRMAKLCLPKIFYEDEFRDAIKPNKDGTPAYGAAQALAMRLTGNILAFALLVYAFAHVFGILNVG